MGLKWLFPLLLILPWVLLGGCNVSEQYPFIDFHQLEQRTSHSPEKENNSFRVSLAAITSSRESVIYYEALLKQLAGKLGRPIELVQRNTYSEVNELLRTGQIDLAFVCTYSYVAGHDQFGLELIAVPERQGKTTYQSYIITRKDSGIEEFSELEGRSFAFTDPMSATGYLYPLALLQLKQSRPEQFFADYSFTYSHDNSVRSVLEGIADGAAVESLVFEHMIDLEPEIGHRIRIINKSPAFPSPPVVVRPNLDAKTKEQLQDFFFNLAQTEQGQQILANMGLDGYQPIQDSAYNPIRSLGMVIQQ